MLLLFAFLRVLCFFACDYLLGCGGMFHSGFIRYDMLYVVVYNILYGGHLMLAKTETNVNLASAGKLMNRLDGYTRLFPNTFHSKTM